MTRALGAAVLGLLLLAQLWARRLNTLDLRPLTDLLAFHVEA